MADSDGISHGRMKGPTARGRAAATAASGAADERGTAPGSCSPGVDAYNAGDDSFGGGASGALLEYFHKTVTTDDEELTGKQGQGSSAGTPSSPCLSGQWSLSHRIVDRGSTASFEDRARRLMAVLLARHIRPDQAIQGGM